MRSAHAAHIIQSELSLDGSGFLTRVTGLLDCLGFTIWKKISLLQFSLLDKWIGTNQYFFYDTYDITWVGHLLKVEACFRFIELKTNQKRRTKI